MSEDHKSSLENGINEEIRQNLVDTAVNFLSNPDVRHKPDKSKITFLKNKGLNDAEISLAFEKAKSHPQYQSSAIQSLPSQPPPLPYPQRTYSFWSQIGRISSSFIVLGIALYGLHHFYEMYIEPWLFGTKSEKCQLKLMEEQLLELNKNIQQLSSTVSSLEKTLNTHKQQIDTVIEASGVVSTSVSSLKKEMGNVKSLLINRHQFPAVPKVASPTIPVWQLQSSEDTETESAARKNGEHDTATLTDVKESISNPSSTEPSLSNKEENGTSDVISDPNNESEQKEAEMA